MTQSESSGSNLGASIFKIIQTWLAASPITCGLIALAASVVGVIMLVLTLINGWDALLKALNIIPNATVSNPRTLIVGIKPMGQFVTVSYQLPSIDNPLNMHCGWNDESQSWVYHAFVVEVKAGTDLSTLKETDITYDEEKDIYTISLPNPTLTNCTILSSDRYNVGASNPIGWQCFFSYEREVDRLGGYEIINAMREKVLTEGIIEDARLANQERLSSFFEAMTGKKVQFIYKSDVLPHDTTCQPALLRLWHRHVDSTTGTVYFTKNLESH